MRDLLRDVNYCACLVLLFCALILGKGYLSIRQSSFTDWRISIRFYISEVAYLIGPPFVWCFDHCNV